MIRELLYLVTDTELYFLIPLEVSLDMLFQFLNILSIMFFLSILQLSLKLSYA